MKENVRELLRTLSMVSAGVGFVLLMGEVGKPEKYDEFRYKSAEKNKKTESAMINKHDEKNKSTFGTVAMFAGLIGLIMTEKKEEQH